MALDDHNQPLMWLEADSPEELRAMMVRTNRRFGKRFHFLNPLFARGKWYVWFELREADKAMKDEEEKAE